MSKTNALQNRMSPAINAYRRTYQSYPESSFAAEALGRVVRHYVETENFAQAAELLQSVFADYPDASFLDEMLMLWANVAFRMGDNPTAKAKLQQLIFDYPSSQFVAEARKKLAGLKGEDEGAAANEFPNFQDANELAPKGKTKRSTGGIPLPWRSFGG